MASVRECLPRTAETYLREEELRAERNYLLKREMLRNDVLRNQADFDAVYNKGKSIGDKYVVVFYLKNQLDHNRTGFLATKKVGNSVERNRARRLMKESYRHFRDTIPTGYDIIIIARNTISGRSFREVDQSIRNAFRRTGIISGKKI
jgi:ribonuclease P protein component